MRGKWRRKAEEFSHNAPRTKTHEAEDFSVGVGFEALANCFSPEGERFLPSSMDTLIDKWYAASVSSLRRQGC
jgi:hypothetical protein